MNSSSFGLFVVRARGSLTSVPWPQIPRFANSLVNSSREMKRRETLGEGRQQEGWTQSKGIRYCERKKGAGLAIKTDLGEG